MIQKCEFEFSDIPIPERQQKPRNNGLTMMIDWGLPVEIQESCLKSQGLYVDEAKIADSIVRLMPKEHLEKKISAYTTEGIFTFPGGLFAELAIAQGNFEIFLEGAKKAGFSGVEISDNLIQIAPKKKKELIYKAVNAYGMTVMAEVGRKEGSMTKEQIVADVENCLEAGAAMVLIEAHELFHNEIREDVFVELQKRISVQRIMFELPVVVLPGVTRDYKHRICAWIVAQIGTEVNLANVEWDEIYLTECIRRGMDGDTSHPGGAYRLAGVESAEE